MPRYDFVCGLCGKTTTEKVDYNQREEDRPCRCGGTMSYTFPVDAILGFIPFEPYFDEGLGVDVRGRNERNQIMGSMGLVEAGDKVHGARNEGKFGKSGLTGLTLAERQRKEEKARTASENVTVTAIHRDGSERHHRVGDLKKTDRVLSLKTGGR